MENSKYSRYTASFLQTKEQNKLYNNGNINNIFLPRPSIINYTELSHFPDVIRYESFPRNTSNINIKSDIAQPPSYRDIYFNKFTSKEANQNQFNFQENVSPLGLPNTKSYCYMNSVIQSLSHCIEFSNAVSSYKLDKDDHTINSDREIDSILVSLFFELMHDIGYRHEDRVPSSSLAFQKIHEKFPEFSDGEQDADEYLQFLLNKLNDVTKSKPKKMNKNQKEDKFVSFDRFLNDNNSFATRLFCGQMNNELQCFRCNFSKPSFQIFWVLPLPIMSNDENDVEISLESCLKTMLANEKLDGKKCSKCSNENSIFTRTEITHWPIYLIIHLKRHVQLTYSRKARTKITLDINEYLTINKETKYSFLGVIDHIGSTVSGHYVSKLRDLNDNSMWWCFNDTVVSKIVHPQEEIITENTTTYFFSKLNTIPSK